MNARIIAFVACRLFAVYLLIMYGVSFLTQLLIISLSPHPEGSEPAIRQYILTAGLAAAFYVMFAFALWTGASWLSRAVSAPMPEKLVDKPADDRWQAVVVTCVGWLTLVLAIGQVIHVFVMLTQSGPSDINLPLVLPALVYLILGGFLTLFPLKVVRGLEWLREWGRKPMIKVEDQ